MLKYKKVAATVTFLAGLCLSGTAMAADEASAVETISSSSNTLFLLLGAVMILAMHGGFAFLEVGSVRRKNQVNALNKIICEWGFSTIIYFLIGYPIARGIHFLRPISELDADNGIEFVKFFFFLGFAACIPAIISGGVAERAKFWTNSLAGAIFVGLVYPLIEWISWWSGDVPTFLGFKAEWLPKVFSEFHDFAGSSVVHATGGWLALHRNIDGAGGKTELNLTVQLSGLHRFR
ncbi:MAG: ammonium transporter [Pontiellaceae bacterium]|nr:ammonium transporter [Pontiellaceae bacterium]MBN2785103.1 ammonium transporter [Pontiellaceae bacterium]